ncbi:MAG: MBL fold metallo-hydrolase [Roseomonas sp.]|jgi:glyoxylase-like metal-dependent hydrolase (beta-lactamase superfamily II)|nr:MBL fold metallo-hydrolase [Roseomonas sp.]
MGETTKRIRAAGGKAERLGVDGVELYALCDGYLDMELSRFPDVKRGIGDDLAIADGQDLNDMTVSVNAFLLRHGDRLCLIDAGDGIWRGDTLGHLPRALEKLGIAPDQITDLFMTHLHRDHAGGLFHEGRLVYPNATMYAAADEIAFWSAPEKIDGVQRVQLPIAEAALRAYRERLVVIHPGEEILPGVAVRALPGHTPGQIGFQLGKEKPLLIAADALHLPALQIKHPEWGFLFDVDQAQSLATRTALLAEAAQSGLRLAGAHYPFPGVIGVTQGPDGHGFRNAVD